MGVVEFELVSELAAAAIHQQPAAHRLEEHVDGELRAFLKQGHGGERIGGGLSAPEKRQARFADQGMAPLVKADEERVTDHEFGEVSLLGARLLDARLEGVAAGGDILVPGRGERVRSGAEDEGQSKGGLRKHGRVVPICARTMPAEGTRDKSSRWMVGMIAGKCCLC